MEAGPEINMLVATEVMGWRWDDDWGCLIPPEQKAKPWEMWTEWQLTEDDDEYVYHHLPVHENWVGGVQYSGEAKKIHLPNWSTDIAAAMKLEPHMQHFELRRMADGTWECQSRACELYYPHDPEECRGQQCYYAYAETAALAICLAELGARGIELE